MEHSEGKYMNNLILLSIGVIASIVMAGHAGWHLGLGLGSAFCLSAIASSWVYGLFEPDSDHGPDPLMLGIVTCLALVGSAAIALIGGVAYALLVRPEGLPWWLAWLGFHLGAAAAGSVIAYALTKAGAWADRLRATLGW